MANSIKNTRLDIEGLAKRSWHYIHKRFRTPFYIYLLWEGVSKHQNASIPLKYEMGAVLYLDTQLMFANELLYVNCIP